MVGALRAAVTRDQAVLERIGRDIIEGLRPAGSVMRLDDLVAEFGVSRTVVRDAIRGLETLGLVQSRRRVGLVVQPLPAWSLYHPSIIAWRVEARNPRAQLEAIAELRLAVEPMAARLAASRRTAAAAAELVEIAAKLATAGRSGDWPAFLALDISFHERLLAASDNDMFTALGMSVGAALTGRALEDLTPPTPVEHAFDLHEAVAASIERRDADGAEAGMRELIQEVLTDFRRP